MYSYFDSNTWVTPFGLLFLTAIFIAWWLARRNAMAAGIDGSHIDFLIPLTIIVGVAGGTLLSMFMPMDHMVAGEMMNHGIRVRLFGMLATGAVAMFVYSHFSGLSSGVQYPPGSLPYEQHLALGLIEPGALASLPVFPVQLYEAALLLLVLFALWRFPWRQYPNGTLAVIVVCVYALLRFFIEYIRADGHIVMGNLTVTQLQCVLLLASSLLLPRMLRRNVVSSGDAPNDFDHRTE